MKILVVGAGIAGMTLAALLERRGVRVTVLEKAGSTGHAGYMLGLYRLGSRVLHGLGLYEELVRESFECRTYAAFDGSGRPIARWSLEPISGKYGPLLSCTRPRLVEILRAGMGTADVRFNQTVSAIDASARDSVRVVLADGTAESYDLVVGADGIGSTVRRLVFGEQRRYDTGWGGWVWWVENELCPPDSFQEFWGAGRFLGIYPTRAGTGIFAGAPATDGFAEVEGRRERLLRRFAGMGETVDRALAALPEGGEMFFWRLADVRSREWVRNRVVLLGDAAAGFLPTAGVGASMAMESAAVLADELSRTDARFADHALSLYVKRRKSRVEAIQTDSRKLARLMFVKSPPLAAARNFASRFLSLESAMSAIIRAFEEPI